MFQAWLMENAFLSADDFTLAAIAGNTTLASSLIWSSRSSKGTTSGRTSETCDLAFQRK